MTEKNKGNQGKLFTILGIILIVVGLGADFIGLGDGAQFGPRQLVATFLGIFLLLFGMKACKCSKS